MKLGVVGPRSRRLVLSWLILPLLLATAAPAMAQDLDAIGTVKQVAGEVEICHGGIDCRQAEEGDIVFADDTFKTGRRGRTLIHLNDPRLNRRGAGPATIHMSPNTEIAIRLYVSRLTREEKRSTMDVIRGLIRAIVEPLEGRPIPVQVRTGTTICRIPGTTFAVGHDPDAGSSTVAVQDGSVSCDVADEEHAVEAMEKLTVSARGDVSVDAMALGEWIAMEREILGELGDLDGAGTFAGIWSSTYGKELVLAQAGDRVTGSYDADDGQVVFTVTGDRTLDGFWIEDASGVECGSAKEGRNFWGRLILEFDEALTEYTGTWGYCDAEPNRGWYGSRVGPD